jgi:hypothetical protein
MGTGVISGGLSVGVGPGGLAGRGRAAPASRGIGLLVLAVAIGTFLAYMVRTVPVVAPRLPRSEAVRHWPAAVTGALVVAGVAALVSGAVVIRRRVGRPASDRVARAVGWRLPRPLRWQLVPRRAVLVGAAMSSLLAAGTLLSGYPLWIAGLGALVAWLPLLVLEAGCKYRRYGLFAVFFGVVFFQTLHMGEHTVQVLQLLRTDGSLAHSHGVFGQLDFETVHFVADTIVWLALGVFLVLYRGDNRWLWVAFAAASLHQIEHFHLFWMYHAHPATYAAGGFAGIMGSGGIIGSPLGRPYLHFSYNVIVIVPMLIALWDQARGLDDEDCPVTPARRSTSRSA